MSTAGIQRFSKVLEDMQQARHELIEMGSKAPNTPDGHQDIRLGQLLDIAKQAVSNRFAQITLEGTPKRAKRKKSK